MLTGRSDRHDPTEGEVTRLLRLASEGDEVASSALFDRTYDELRKLARLRMRTRGDATIQPTALVHEAWIRIAGSDALGRVSLDDRESFLAFASRVMRTALVDQVRRARADKRGGGAPPLSLDVVIDLVHETSVPIDDLDSALNRLADEHERGARVVELRFFGGLTLVEVAEELGVSVPTVKRDWHLARIWLRENLLAGRDG